MDLLSMLTSVKGIIIGILVLGIMVFVHELGHFLMARLGGIAVDEFSIGMGKEIIGFTKGETRYRIGWIPFGGFCKMRGEESNDRKEPAKEEEEKDAPDDDSGKKEEAPPTPDPHAMYNRPAWARVIAIAGGPVFNYLFAILVLSIMFMVGFTENPISPRVVVQPPDTNGIAVPAAQAGLTNGDVIIKMRWRKNNLFTRMSKKVKYRELRVQNYGDILETVALNKDTEIEVTYVRNGQTNTTKMTPVYHPELGMGYVGLEYTLLPVIGLVVTNSPATNAGLKVGDRILSFDGKDITYYYEFLNKIDAKKPGDIIRLTLQRQEGTNTMVLEKSIRLTNKEGKAFLGIAPGEADTVQIRRKSKGFFHAFAMGFTEANSILKTKVFDGLAAMFRGKINAQKNMSGPLRIIQITGKVATQSNIVVLLQFMAMISVALGFFNLLPIPGLDGSHFLLNTFEMITTIRPPEKVLIVLEYIGLFFIIGLAVLVFFNDIVNIVLRR